MTGVVNPWAYAPTPGSGWNPLDMSPSGPTVLALSAGNKIGTHVGGAGTGATVRGVKSHSSGGPYYFETEILVAHSDPNGICIGVCDLAATLLDDWGTMGANEALMSCGNAIIASPGGATSGSGVFFDSTSIVLRVLFEPGVGMQVASGGGTFTTLVAFTASATWVPAMNLGYNYAFGQFGQDGSVKLATVAADFAYSVPGGAVEWG